MSISGTCLCGQVKITIDTDQNLNQVVCHCTDCQHVSGGPYGTVFVVPDNLIHVTGPTTTFSSKVASGNTVPRQFCSVCGSPISRKSPMVGDNTIVHTGSFGEFFKDKPVAVEFWTKDRWASVKPFEGAVQKELS